MKRTGVNYDYIIGLKKSEEGVIIVKYPILKHDREIEKAFDYLEDESRIASDVYNLFNFFSRTFDSCIYSDYQDCFIKEIISPEFNEHGYRKIYQENLENKYKTRLNRLSHTQLNDELVTQRIRKEVIRELSAIDREIKKKIIEKAIPYLYALEYENTLFRYNIDNECIVYSNERHGDGRNINNGKYRIVHKVNDDLSVVLETNFCYGNSSYFHITVIYMSIPLIPYSVWIKYYYAGYDELLSCTRSFGLKRENWNCCITWLADFINSAIKNPSSFIKNEVITEIRELMSGLDEIFRMTSDQFEKILSVKRNTDDNRYIGIRSVYDATKFDLDEYHIAPEETAMIYKMEKITGALRFLDSLRKFEELYDEVSNSINCIIQMNVSLLPEIINAMPPIEKEIEKLAKQLEKKKKELSFPLYWYTYYQMQLDEELSKVLSTQDCEKIIERFKRKKPKYNMWKKEVETLESQIASIKLMFKKRENILKRLRGFESLVTKYALQSSLAAGVQN